MARITEKAKKLADKTKVPTMPTPKEHPAVKPISPIHTPTPKNIKPITPEKPYSERKGVKLQRPKPEKKVKSVPTKAEQRKKVAKEFDIPNIMSYSDEIWKGLSPETKQALIKQQLTLNENPNAIALKRQEMYADNYKQYMEKANLDLALAQAVYEWIKNGLRSKEELERLPDIDSSAYYVGDVDDIRTISGGSELDDIARAIGYSSYFDFYDSFEYNSYLADYYKDKNKKEKEEDKIK